MNKILLLFGHYPKEQYLDIIQNSKNGIQYAADALQWSLIDGIEQNYSNFDIISLPHIGSYPKRYKKINFVGKDNCETSKGKIYQSISFCNLTLYKIQSRYYNIKKYLSKNFQNDAQELTILVYAITSPFLRAAVNFKKRNPNIKICLIVPDLPQYMSDSRNILIKILKTFDGYFIEKYLKQVDSFVLLTENMKELLPNQGKPYEVVEGIYNPKDDVCGEKQSSVKNILYTGTLSRRFGVLDLVSAFMLTKNSDYRLIICGEGDTQNEILKLAKIDPRIIFKGIMKREEVLKMQKESHLLVNPRPPEGEFTKYSFPSKTMEYLASGTPTLIYKLSGIPEEYFKYCFTLEESGIDKMSKKIDEILNMSDEELTNIGKNARDFILEHKNPKNQCSKIINMILSC